MLKISTFHVNLKPKLKDLLDIRRKTMLNKVIVFVIFGPTHPLMSNGIL